MKVRQVLPCPCQLCQPGSHAVSTWLQSSFNAKSVWYNAFEDASYRMDFYMARHTLYLAPRFLVVNNCDTPDISVSFAFACLTLRSISLTLYPSTTLSSWLCENFCCHAGGATRPSLWLGQRRGTCLLAADACSLSDNAQQHISLTDLVVF